MYIAIFYHLPVSGAKRVVFEQAKWLKSFGHKIDIYTIKHPDSFFNPSDFAENTFLYDYKPITLIFPFIKRLTKDCSDFILLKNLHRIIAADIDKKKYDVALIHTDFLTQAPFLLRFLKTTNIYFCLEPLRIAYEYGLRIDQKLPTVNRLYETVNRAIRKKIDIENARSAHQTTAISYFGRELMIQAFDLYPKVFYLGIDTDIFRKVSVKKKNQILFVGQKLAINGYDHAIQALNYIPEEDRPELKIVSWDKNRKERLSDEELVKLYNESILTLSLSTFDTFGLVPLESLACNTPVIAFRVAGYRETILHGKMGFLVEFDPREIAEKIMFFLDKPKLAEQMGKNGRKWVQEDWNQEKQMRNLEHLLINTISHESKKI